MHAEYLLVLPIESIATGAKFERGAPLPPLHCTVMPWFAVSESALARLEKATIKLMKRCGPITLISQHRAYFGPNENVPVHTLTISRELAALHAGFLGILAEVGCLPMDCQYIGDGYAPHVSDSEGRMFEPGSRHVADTLKLVKKDSELKVVAATFWFRN